MVTSSSPGIERPAAGIWSLDGEQLSSVESFDVGPAIVLVPSESVLLTIADLPLPTPRRRAEALPFAVEDHVAQPLTAVHVALGAEVGEGRYLAGAVSQELMQRWVAVLAEAGLARAAIVPDVLALPRPAPGGWSIDAAAGRALVRSDDGGGFALPLVNLEAAWRAAGMPACRSFGETLPPGMAASPADLAAAPLAARLTAPALDLRQGAYARARRAVPPLVRRIALIAAAGVIAHGAIAAADTLALDHIASKRAQETRALALTIAPSAAIGDDVAAGVADLLPAYGAGPSSFLPLLGRVSAALKPLGPGTALRDISFDGSANTVAIDVEAPDIAGLQRVGQALQAAGLASESGAASAADGKAVGAFLIRGGR